MREITSFGRSNAAHSNSRARRLAMTMAISGAIASCGIASAASSWNGPGGTTSTPTSGLWSVSTNWDSAPVSSPTTALNFLGGTTVYTSTDDISGDFLLNSLTLNSTAGTIAAAAGSNLDLGGTSPTVTQSAAGIFKISAPVTVSANTAVSVVNGGEIDFTGPVTTGSSNGITISNSSGTGNATVKFTGANTNATLTVNPNVTAVAGLSTNLTTLGSGPVTLAGGTLVLQGQQSTGFGQQPIGVSGFNADTIIDAASGVTAAQHANNVTVVNVTGVVLAGTNATPSGTVYVSSAGVLTTDVSAPGEVHNQTVFFQNGWSSNGNQTGLPASGYFTSAIKNVNHVNTGFNFAYNGTSTDYAHNNTLYFTNTDIVTPAGSPDAKTLTLTTPGTATTLDFLATALAATTFDVTLNFSSGAPTTFTSGISTGPLSNGTSLPNVALANITGTNNGNSNDIDNGGFGKMHLTESDITLSPTDAARTINSITFTPTSGLTGSASAEIYAVSGSGTFGAFTFPSQTYANNITVTADSTIAVANSLAATVGNLSIGNNQLSISSADTTTGPYSLTTGAITLTGNPTFSAPKSTSGGTGTLNLGALNDGGVARTISINANTGIVALNAATSNLSAGTNINVPTGATLNIATGNSSGAASVNVNGGTVNGTATDGTVTDGGTGVTSLTNNTGGNYVLNSGTLNGAVAFGLGSLSKVTINGGTFLMSSAQQVSSLNNTGTVGTISLGANALIIGNATDNLSSTFGGLITGTALTGALGKFGTGSLTLTGSTNTQQFTGVLQGSLIVAAASTVSGSAFTTGSTTPVHGIIVGPLGSNDVVVGTGGGAQNSALLLDTPGRAIANTVYVASGGHGIAGQGEAEIGGLNTSGVTTFGGDFVLGSGNQGAYGLTGVAVIGASNGGEVDIAGNIISNHNASNNTDGSKGPLTSPVSIRNLSGTGNAVVKILGQNNSYRTGTEIQSNVTVVVPLTTSSRPLGYGQLALGGGTLALQGQQASGAQLSNLVTNAGFNKAIVVPVGATSALAATTATIDGSSVLYQKGYVNTASTTGTFVTNTNVALPGGLNGNTFVSEYNPDVTFQLQPYTGNSALQLQAGASPNVSTGTLTLATPAAFKSINLLTLNGNGQTSMNVTFNLTDPVTGTPSTETQTLTTQNWFYGHTNNVLNLPSVINSGQISNFQRLAIGGINNGTTASVGAATPLGAIVRSTDAFNSNPASMYEDDYTLAAADQSKILNSITFTVTNYNSQTSTDNIMAVSGQAYAAPVTLTTQTLPNNVTFTSQVGTIDVSGSLNAVVGNYVNIGGNADKNIVIPGNTLNVVSSDTSGSPYSLTLGTLPDTTDALNTVPSVRFLGNDATFNVANSAGGGTGTLVLGALDDTFEPGSTQIINKTGPGKLTLSAPAISLQAGATVNVTAGTLNVNDLNALGTQATVNVTGALNIGGNTGTSGPGSIAVAALNVGPAAKVSVQDASLHANHTVLIAGSLAITAGGQVDLNGNDMIVQNTSADSLFSQLQAGFNAHAGYWNGTTGIVSTTAAHDTRFLTTLGYRQSDGTSFDGQSPSTADALVKYTYYGDANLDGIVNGADYQQIDMGFGTGATGWINGDFNYDGVINGSDFALIDNTFNQITATGASSLAVIASPSSLLAGPAVSVVPEPTTLGLLGVGAIGLLGRRRRRHA